MKLFQSKALMLDFTVPYHTFINWHPGQEPITHSLHSSCTLASTLSRIFLFLEHYCDICGSFLISCENTVMFANTLKNKFSLLSAIYEILSVACMWSITVEHHSSHMIGHYKNTHEKKRDGTGLTQRVSVENGSSGK